MSLGWRPEHESYIIEWLGAVYLCDITQNPSVSCPHDIDV